MLHASLDKRRIDNEEEEEGEGLNTDINKNKTSEIKAAGNFNEQYHNGFCHRWRRAQIQDESHNSHYFFAEEQCIYISNDAAILIKIELHYFIWTASQMNNPTIKLWAPVLFALFIQLSSKTQGVSKGQIQSYSLTQTSPKQPDPALWTRFMDISYTIT